MAEGGDDPKDNPFSFKKFVKKQSPDLNAPSDKDSKSENVGIFELPDVQNTENQRESRAKGKDDENPFSFKKFLKGGARPKKSNSGGPLSTLDLANDLPDFVQDHFNTNDTNSRKGRSPHEGVSLPDFALDSTNSSPRVAELDLNLSRLNSNSIGAVYENLPDLESSLDNTLPHLDLGGGSRNLDSFNENEFCLNDSNRNDNEDWVLPSAHPTGGLPDFLSDSAMLDDASKHKKSNLQDNVYAVSDDFLYKQSNGESETELQRLHTENQKLREELNEARMFAERESKRVAEVLQEMESIQSKEAEENSALENMVQQVEANLKTTTERAIQAENTIVKLKQEVKSLQGQMKTLRSENAILKGGGPGQDPVREKTKYASEQLALAAKNAEQTLKQLMGGVESIKLISDVLASIDRISEENTNTEDSSDSSRSWDKSKGSHGGARRKSPSGAAGWSSQGGATGGTSTP